MDLKKGGGGEGAKWRHEVSMTWKGERKWRRYPGVGQLARSPHRKGIP